MRPQTVSIKVRFLRNFTRPDGLMQNCVVGHLRDCCASHRQHNRVLLVIQSNTKENEFHVYLNFSKCLT